MVTATSWMYVVDWGPWIWQMLCKSFAYDIERYFWRVVDSIWSFVVSETKTKWNVYCVARQNHDSRYVHWIRQIYTRPVELATRPRFFHRISHCSKTKFEKGNDQLLKTTSNLFFAPLNGFVYLCLTCSLPFTICRVFLFNFILFEPREIWTQLRNKQEKACSHLCYVNLLALIFCRIFSDFEHYSSKKKCSCYEWKRLRSVGVAITSRSCFRFNRVS